VNAPSNALDRMVGPNAQVLAGSQATAIEQSRAVAEVQAMVVVAQQRPRNIQAALAEMRQSCSMKEMAERAFFRFPRGDKNVTGPTVHLMRELARCFGNITHGISELARNDEAGVSEMQAYAWDLQTNTRSAQIFMVPHKRDGRRASRLEDQRDVYELTANQGARREREAIRRVLPPWFVEEAISICNKTLEHGGGKPLPKRIADAIALFEGMGVTVDAIEQKLGRPNGKWTAHDVAQLVVIWKSIDRGEVTAEDEFPAERVTVEEVKRPAAAPSTNGRAPAEEPPAEAEPPADEDLSGVWPEPAPIPGTES